MNAYDWGVKHESCEEGLEARKAYSTQSEWWKGCQRGDWLIWQLRQLPAAQLQEALPALLRAVNKIVARAKAKTDAATYSVMAWAAELSLQADDIRAEIPEWIWE